MNNQNTVTMENTIETIIRREFGKNLIGITEQVDIQIGSDDTRKEFGVLIDTSWGQNFCQYQFDMTTEEIRSQAALSVSTLMRYYGQGKGSFRMEMPSNFTI